MASWSRLTYARRLFLWLVAYSLVMVACFVSYQYIREKEFKADELDLRLRLVNERILAELEDDGRDFADLDASDIYPSDQLRISIIDSTGHMIYDNRAFGMAPADHSDRSEIMKARLIGHAYTVRRHSASTGGTYFYSATRGDNGMIVRTALPYDVSLTRLLRADYGFLRIMGLITLFMCVVGFLATRRLGSHISRLALFASRAEKGERIYDTAPFPDDELGRISNNIVRLYSRLQQAVADRDREHREAIRQMHEKERIKKQLTNNINHELKTPLASIELCLETLIAHDDMPAEKRREFISRSLANSGRLRRLLDDVSLITRMDDGAHAIAMASLDLADVVADVVAECEPLAEARNMTINNSITEPILLTGNASLLASVFRNLIDNAVSYSGGSAITIGTASCGPDCVTVVLADDGVGVAADHLPHLFERFYRIDKGRSRAAGGTGLGLSIVKNALRIHGATVKVSNRSTGGLEFEMSFSIQPSAG